MPKKKEILAALGSRLDIPPALLPGDFSLFMTGQREVTVMGCRRILFYSDIEIHLQVAKKTLTVKGEGLLCTAFGAGSVTIAGHIVALSFQGQTKE